MYTIHSVGLQQFDFCAAKIISSYLCYSAMDKYFKARRYFRNYPAMLYLSSLHLPMWCNTGEFFITLKYITKLMITYTDNSLAH